MTADHHKLQSSCKDLWSGCRGHAALLQVSQLCILWGLLFKIPHSHHLLGNYIQLQSKDCKPANNKPVFCLQITLMFSDLFLILGRHQQ